MILLEFFTQRQASLDRCFFLSMIIFPSRLAFIERYRSASCEQLRELHPVPKTPS
jgi:hypothetical protein